MAGRGLQHLKFMQRARQREEAIKKADEEEAAIHDSCWVASVKSRYAQNRCVVIMEADPKPGALLGRMSFQKFNSTVDKLNEEAEALYAKRAVTAREKTSGAREGLTEKTARINEVTQSRDVRETEADDPDKDSPQKRPKLEPDPGSTAGIARLETDNQPKSNFKPWKGWRDGGDYRVLRPPGCR